MARPEKPIDWDECDKLLISQCNAEEIAGHFGMHVCNLRRKIREKYNTTFLDYALPKYSEGKKLLRAKQFQVAMSGNVKMLERLGDIYLDQREKQDTKQPLTININGKLASGIDIRAEELPSTDNQGIEQRDEESSLGST